MQLKDFIHLVRKGWVYILVFAVVGASAGIALSVFTPKKYASTTRLFVSTRTPDTASDLLTGSSFTQQRVQSYADIVTSPAVLAPVVSKLSGSITYDQLKTQVSATIPLNTVLIEIKVLDGSPYRAANLANDIATSFTQTIDELESSATSANSLVKLKVIQPGDINLTADSPKPLLDSAIGLLIGLLLGFVLALLRDRLDLRLRSSDEVKAYTHASTLGTITFDPKLDEHRLIVHASPRSIQAEAYRQLRTNIQFVEAAEDRKSIVVSSSVPNEGKTTTSCNLAIALADTGAKVLLMDCDFRKPDVHGYMGIEGAFGLTDTLIGRGKLSDAIQTWGENKLDVLPAGQVPPNPSELLGSAAMAKLLADLEKKYDHIIIDAAPLLPVTDAAILSKMTGGVILVVGLGKTTRPQIQGSVHHITAVGGRIVGTVLNKVRVTGSNATQYGYGYGQQYGKVYGE
jgi:capsular exopolysaccharide synthesis family protein